MCSPANCRTCSKTTWSGCGQHVQQVMANVPKARQCTCTEQDHQAARAAKSASGGGSLLDRFRKR